MRKLLLSLIALASIAFGVCSPASAQSNIIGSGIWGDAKPRGGGTILSIDGSGASGIASGSGTTWTMNGITAAQIRSHPYPIRSASPGICDPNGASSGDQTFWALASSTLSSDAITVTFSATETATVMAAIAIHGAHTAAPFDINGSLPATSGFGGTVSGKTTSNANDILFGFYNNSGGLTASSPFTMVYNNNGAFATYDVVSATQSGVTIPDAGTTAFNGVGDAIIQGP